LPLYSEAVALAADVDTLCNRANVLGQLNRDIEAVADVRLALSKAPADRYCLEQAVWLASRMSTADESIALMSRVIEADPNRADALRQRGWRYQQKNMQDLAFADYLAAAKLGDAWAELMTGKYLWSGMGVKQDRDAALVWLRKAAEKGHPDAKLSLKQALEQLAQK
jgi:TPR repeat protein